jgi:hypothetical protein
MFQKVRETWPARTENPSPAIRQFALVSALTQSGHWYLNQAIVGVSRYKVFMWGRIIIGAVVVALVAVWLSAIWLLIVDPRVFLPKLPMW